MSLAPSRAKPAADRSSRVRHPWLRYLLGRLAGVVLVPAVLVVGTFAIVQLLPGDPAAVAAGRNADPAQTERVRHELGLDRSWVARFGDYVSGLATGDLGTSYRSGEPVTDVLAQRLPYAVELVPAAILVGSVVAASSTSTPGTGGPLSSGLLGGTVVAASVFAWPGLGARVVEAILNRDYPVVQGAVLALGVPACLVGLAVDLLLALPNRNTLTGNPQA
ncbi:ABC transporter permease [Embleya sp. NPDC005971]|uniref:ABC transporter permease n=1 Tax=unclassified Embleya TaxID=2699296 RepID=UPI0033FA715E